MHTESVTQDDAHGTQPPGVVRRMEHLIAPAAAVFVGCLMAAQSRVNGTLSEHSGRPMVAALISFGSGLLVCLLLVLFVPPIRRAAQEIPRALRDHRLRPIECIGGLFGGLYVATQSWAVPIIGIAVLSVATIGGQTTAALGIDRLGWGTTGRHPVSPARLLGAALALIGVVVSASARHGSGGFSWAPVVVAVLIGAGMATQQAVNARVNRVAGHVMAATAQNFLVGMLTLLAVSAVQLAVQPGSWAMPSGASWWAYTGGLLGIVFIAVSAWVVRDLGVLLFGLLSVSGQLVGALVLDLLSPATREHVGGQLVLGVLISLVAAVGAGLAAARQR